MPTAKQLLLGSFRSVLSSVSCCVVTPELQREFGGSEGRPMLLELWTAFQVLARYCSRFVADQVLATGISLSVSDEGVRDNDLRVG